MEKIDWVVGNEKRFGEFISGLNDKSKVGLISHTDLDGIASAKMVNEAVGVDFMKFVNYEELELDLIKELKEKKISKLIMTDLYLNEDSEEFIKELEKNFEVLIIDHHPFYRDFNSERVVFFNADGFCAAYLCYVLFSKAKSLEEYDWLIACACLSDWQYQKNSEWMGEIYKKYGEEFLVDDVKTGRFWGMQDVIVKSIIYFEKEESIESVFDRLNSDMGCLEDLKQYSEIVQKEIDEFVDKFEKEKQEIKDGYFWEMPDFKYWIKSIVCTLASAKYWTKTIIVIKKSGDLYNVSARRQDRKVDSGKLLQKLVEGFEGAGAGGHVPAAGGHFRVEDREIFLKRLKDL